MRRARILQEVRQIRFEELYERRQRRDVTMVEAAEMLGITARTVRRRSMCYDAEGREGLQDRRLGRASARAVPVDEALRMVTLYETRDTGWTVKHVHEHWQQAHGGPRSYSWTKKTLQAAGHVARAPRRGAHRKKRPRKPWPGMMLHQDGSTHEGVPGCQWDVIVTLDDATTEISSAFFVEEEGTLSRFRGLREVMETKGLFSSLYTDRGSHYWYTEAAGGRVDKVRLTQVHRALQPVGITLIPAYSPERGAGRSASSAPCKTGYPKSERSPGSRRWRRPTSTWPRGFCPPTTSVLPCRPQSRDGLCAVDWVEPRRNSGCTRRADRGQRQYGAVSGPESADPTGPASVP